MKNINLKMCMYQCVCSYVHPAGTIQGMDLTWAVCLKNMHAYQHVYTYLYVCVYIHSVGTMDGVDLTWAMCVKDCPDQLSGSGDAPSPPNMCYMPFQVILQHTATHCNTLQHTISHCNTLRRSGVALSPPNMCYTTFQV